MIQDWNYINGMPPDDGHVLRSEIAELKICLRQMVEAYKDLNEVDRGELCACGNEDCQEVVRAWELMDEASDQAKVALNLF